MILALVLLMLLGLSVARDVLSFVFTLAGVSPSRHTSHGLQEVVVEDNDSRNKIALIEVQGLISGAALDGRGRDIVSLIRDQLRIAAADDNVKAILLKVDSPGGEVMASDEISQAIADFQNQTQKPVVATMGGLAASGGYYVSAPCQWIVANDLTITGSIGVILHTYNYRGLLAKVGVRPEIFKSGKFKDMLSGEKTEEETLPEERKMAQAMIDQTFARFKEVVAKGRQRAQQRNQGKGQSLIPDWEQYADGRILMGAEAFKYGFVDQVGNFDAAVKQTRVLAAISNANLVRYDQPFDIGTVLRWFVKSEPPTLKVDIGLDTPRLQFGRLYFLPPALFH